MSPNVPQGEALNSPPDSPAVEAPHWWLRVLLPLSGRIRELVIVPVFFGSCALAISFAIRPVYTAKVSFIPPSPQQSGASAALQALGTVGALAGGGAAFKNPLDQYSALLKSDTIQNRIIEKFNLQNRYHENLLVRARRKLSSNTKVITFKKEGIISVEVDDEDPKFAAELANAYTDELNALNERLALTEAKLRRAFYEQQLNRTKSALIQAERALSDTRVNASTMRAQPSAAVESYARIQAQLSAAEVRFSALRSYLTPEAPEFKAASQAIKDLREQLAKAEKLDSSAQDSDYISRFREFKYQETLFEALARPLELARIDEAKEGTGVQIVDPAVPPELKSYPHKSFIAATAAVVSEFVLAFSVLALSGWRNMRTAPQNAALIEKIKRNLARSIGRHRSV